MNIKPKGRKGDIVIQELDGEVLIYDLKKNKAFCLNETSSLVWQLCDGKNSVSEISETIGKKLNASANEDLVWLALDQLKKEKLIENGDELISNFEGLSRRAVIKKIGLGTMIALPLVSSLVAPTAAHAQSAGALAPNGTVVGVIVGPVPSNCGNTNTGTRNADCDNAYAALCASGNTNSGTCGGTTPGVPATNAYTFTCTCAP